MFLLKKLARKGLIQQISTKLCFKEQHLDQFKQPACYVDWGP